MGQKGCKLTPEETRELMQCTYCKFLKVNYSLSYHFGEDFANARAVPSVFVFYITEYSVFLALAVDKKELQKW